MKQKLNKQGLDAVTQKHVDDLARVYLQAEQKLNKITEHYIVNHVASAAYYQAQRKQVLLVLAQLQQEGSTIITKAILVSAQKGYDRANSIISGTGYKFDAALAGGPDARVVRTLVDNATKKIADTNVLIGRRVDDNLRAIQTSVLSVSKAAGLDNAAASKLLQEELLKSGIVFNSKGLLSQPTLTISGRNFGLQSYSKMVARTLSREAHTQAQIARQQEIGIDLVEIIKGIDGSDDFCAPYLDKVFSLSGNDPKYDYLNEQPPFHPNCTCVLTPHVEL